MKMFGMLNFAGFKVLFPLLLLLVSGFVQAQSLVELLDLARRTEPTHQSAKANLEAAEARVNQAVGAMLPQISANANTNRNKRDYQTRNEAVPQEQETYNSHAYQVSLTQPIWRYSNIESWRQARNVAEQAGKQLLGSEQELFAKLVTAWFDVLAVRDSKIFSGKQYEAKSRQWEVIRRGAELGAYGQPQVEEAKAKMDQAMAEVATAEAEYEAKRAALEQLVGPLQILDPPYMRGDAELVNLTGEKLDSWLAHVGKENPNILAAMKAFDAASVEVRKQYGGTLQRLTWFPVMARTVSK
jgi:outer membrane protein